MRHTLGSVGGSGQGQFPVLETTTATVLDTNTIGISGTNFADYICGTIIGVEQSGVVRPMAITDCVYDSANTRMKVSLTGNLNTGLGARVRKQAGSDVYHMMNGSKQGVAGFIPGGFTAGTNAADYANTGMGFHNPTARTFRRVGTIQQSADTTYLGGNAVKLTDACGMAMMSTGGDTTGQISYNRGMFFRCGMRINNLGTSGVLPYARSWNSGSDQKTWYYGINTNRTVTVYGYDTGGGANYLNQTSAWTLPALGTWFDLAVEIDTVNTKVRTWINGALQTTFSSALSGYLGGPWSFHTGAWSMNSYNNTYSMSTNGSPVVYVHDFLLLNYAPFGYDVANITIPTKHFSFPGLRETF